jgi:hypothetical protein
MDKEKASGPPSLTALPSARMNSINAGSAMRLTLIAWRYAFPGAKRTAKRVRVFKAKPVCSLIQPQDGVGEVVPSHLVSGFVQNPLEAGTRFLQATLQRSFQKH